MTATLGLLDLEEAAKEAAGNWHKFNCFCWHRKTDLERPEEWAIFYTHHRDSDLRDQSNAEVIAEAMEKFAAGGNPDVVFESHFHWAVGHVDGFSVRVYRRGRITRAFRTYYELQGGSPNTRCWTKDDYSAREYEATIQNIADAAWRVKGSYRLPKGLGGSGLSLALGPRRGRKSRMPMTEADIRAEESLQRAFAALGYEKSE